jgi:hypothetical protein
MADETWAGVLSLANVKTYVFAGETTAPTQWDTPLQIIIDAVIAQVKQELGGCDVVKGTYTAEEVSGTGKTFLLLKHWPILTVTTVTDTDSNTYTVGADNDYTIEDYCLRAPGGWAKGYENFIVSYTAGRATIPRDIVLVCYELIAAKFKAMKMALQGESSRNFPDGSVAYSSVDGGFTKAQLALLAPYKRPLA